MTRVGLLGARGRMGQMVARIIETEFKGKATLVAAVDQGELFSPLLETDVVIDFSLPEAMQQLAREAQRSSFALPAFVVGSTGWTIDQRRELEALSKRAPVVMSSNFSTGVLALLAILKQAGPLLEKLGYNPVIVEAHHKHKKDSPSGTALSIQRAVAPAGPGNVPTHSVRAGEVIGDHEVAFYGTADKITIGHFAQDRSIFARGAVECALWLASKRGPASFDRFFTMDEFFHERVQ